MCGIAGFITRQRNVADRSLLVRMCDRIAHRGPDGSGYYYDGPAALGHRRLSIIDLGGGQQPLGNEDNTIIVIFNGEIYNYQELRRYLDKKGHQFRTNSDTEVIVHLYEEVGERTPEYLNGMFAFAIWDSRQQELFLARDRMGKKPVYYTGAIPSLQFCFASELKALTDIPEFPGDVDQRAVADFLALSYIPDPLTIYQHVRKLEPAHSITVSERGMKLRRYWDLSFKRRDVSFSDACEEIKSLTTDAVRSRMMSDVPLGAFLSGGVDSSAVVGIMSEQAPSRVKTFSIGFADKRFDELRYARLAVRKHETDHREKVVTPSVLDTLEKLVEHFDEPFADSSAIPMLYLSEMTRQHVTVALSGDGADEVFGGYRRYYFGVLEERLRRRLPEWFRSTIIATGARHYPKFDYLPRPFRAKALLGNLAQEIGDAYFTSMSGFRDGGLRAVLSPDLRQDLHGYSPRETFRDLFQTVRHLSPLEQLQAVDFRTYLPGDILVKADRATMAYSLESRSPCLDYRLVELAMSLPPEYKLHGRIGKHVFKQAMASYLPKEIINRTKMGFSVPLATWLRTSLKPVFESSVLQPAMDEFVARPEVSRIWNEHQSGIHNHDRKLWSLLMLALWSAKHRRSQKESAALAGVGR